MDVSIWTPAHPHWWGSEGPPHRWLCVHLRDPCNSGTRSPLPGVSPWVAPFCCWLPPTPHPLPLGRKHSGKWGSLNLLIHIPCARGRGMDAVPLTLQSEVVRFLPCCQVRAHWGAVGASKWPGLSCQAVPPFLQLTRPSFLSCRGLWAEGWGLSLDLSSGPALWGSELPGGEYPGSCFQVGLGGCTGEAWPLMPTARVTEARGSTCRGRQAAQHQARPECHSTLQPQGSPPRWGPRPRLLGLLGAGGTGRQLLPLAASQAESQAGR